MVFKIKNTLRDKGFDLCAWASTSSYNQIISKDGLNSDFSELPEDKLVIAAGHNKNIWDKLEKYQEKANDKSDKQSVFDAYITKVAEELAAEQSN